MIDIFLVPQSTVDSEDVTLRATATLARQVLQFNLRSQSSEDLNDIFLYVSTPHPNHGQNLYPVTATRTKIATAS